MQCMEGRLPRQVAATGCVQACECSSSHAYGAGAKRAQAARSPAAIFSSSSAMPSSVPVCSGLSARSAASLHQIDCTYCECACMRAWLRGLVLGLNSGSVISSRDARAASVVRDS